MYFILIYIFIPLLYSKFYNLHIVRKLTSPQNLFIRTRVLTAGLKLHNFPVILLIWTYFFFFLYYYFIHFIIMFGSIYFSAFYVYPLLQHSKTDIQEGRGVLWPKCFENKDEEISKN